MRCGHKPIFGTSPELIVGSSNNFSGLQTDALAYCLQWVSAN